MNVLRWWTVCQIGQDTYNREERGNLIRAETKIQIECEINFSVKSNTRIKSIWSTHLAICVGSSCSPGGGTEAAARSSSSLAGRTSLLCHSADPWGASARGQKEGSPGKDPGWGWPLACLNKNKESRADNKPRFNSTKGKKKGWWRLSLPGVGMGLCVGEVGRPRWLALTEGTLSWSMPTGLRFMSFILEK